MSAPTINIPNTTLSSSTVAIANNLSVAGATTMAGLTAGAVTASGTVATNSITAVNPSADTLSFTAANININSDVEITGSMQRLSSQIMQVQNNVITLGAIGDGNTSTSDSTRDGAGLLIPGAPANLPTGVDASLYEHSVKWHLNSGTFNSDGSAVLPQSMPMWALSGGNMCITGVDQAGRTAQFNFAPYYGQSGVASLQLFYTVGDGRFVLIETFSAAAFA